MKYSYEYKRMCVEMFTGQCTPYTLPIIGSAGTSIPNCNQNFRVISHITVALIHAVRRVISLNQRFLIALGSDAEIPISQGFRPLCGLTFTLDSAFEGNSRVDAFSPRTISAAYISTPIAIPDIKCIKCCFSVFQNLCSQAEKRRLLTGKRIIPEMPAGTLLPLC